MTTPEQAAANLTLLTPPPTVGRTLGFVSSLGRAVVAPTAANGQPSMLLSGSDQFAALLARHQVQPYDLQSFAQWLQRWNTQRMQMLSAPGAMHFVSLPPPVSASENMGEWPQSSSEMAFPITQEKAFPTAVSGGPVAAQGAATQRYLHLEARRAGRQQGGVMRPLQRSQPPLSPLRTATQPPPSPLGEPPVPLQPEGAAGPLEASGPLRLGAEPPPFGLEPPAAAPQPLSPALGGRGVQDGAFVRSVTQKLFVADLAMGAYAMGLAQTASASAPPLLGAGLTPGALAFLSPPAAAPFAPPEDSMTPAADGGVSAPSLFAPPGPAPSGQAPFLMSGSDSLLQSRPHPPVTPLLPPQTMAIAAFLMDNPPAQAAPVNPALPGSPPAAPLATGPSDMGGPILGQLRPSSLPRVGTSAPGGPPSIGTSSPSLLQTAAQTPPFTTGNPPQSFLTPPYETPSVVGSPASNLLPDPANAPQAVFGVVPAPPSASSLPTMPGTPSLPGTPNLSQVNQPGNVGTQTTNKPLPSLPSLVQTPSLAPTSVGSLPLSLAGQNAPGNALSSGPPHLQALTAAARSVVQLAPPAPAAHVPFAASPQDVPAFAAPSPASQAAASQPPASLTVPPNLPAPVLAPQGQPAISPRRLAPTIVGRLLPSSLLPSAKGDMPPAPPSGPIAGEAPRVIGLNAPNGLPENAPQGTPPPEQKPLTVTPEMGQVTLIAPPLQVASADAESGGVAAQFHWAMLAAGAGPLDEGGLSALKDVLPASAQLLYPAVPMSGHGAGATNLALGGSLLRGVFQRGYGRPDLAPHAGRAAVQGQGTKSQSTPLAAQIVPAKTPNRNTGSLLPGSGASGGGLGALTDAGAGQAKRGGPLDFLGIPTRLAPSLSGSTELTHAIAARGGSGAGAAPITRPHQFAPLLGRVFPAFPSVSAEPNTAAWNKAAPAFGLSGAGNPTQSLVGLLTPEARVLLPSPSGPVPQMEGPRGTQVLSALGRSPSTVTGTPSVTPLGFPSLRARMSSAPLAIGGGAMSGHGGGGSLFTGSGAGGRHFSAAPLQQMTRHTPLAPLGGSPETRFTDTGGSWSHGLSGGLDHPGRYESLPLPPPVHGPLTRFLRVPPAPSGFSGPSSASLPPLGEYSLPASRLIGRPDSGPRAYFAPRPPVMALPPALGRTRRDTPTSFLQRSVTGGGNSPMTRKNDEPKRGASAEAGKGKGAANEVHLLANEVWSLLRRRLATEAERMGRR